MRAKLYTAFIICVLTVGLSTSSAFSQTTVRVAGTPHQDTSIFLWGIANGVFEKLNLRIQIKNTTFNDQIELVASGDVDVAVATVDEIAGRTRLLNKAGKRVLFVAPIWLFEGQIFAARDEFKTLKQLRTTDQTSAALVTFFDQFKGKKIAVPFGSSYDQAIRRLIKSAGMSEDDFRFVSTELEAGINALRDTDVGLAAAGIVERPEAERRGYAVALDSLDMGSVVVVGLITNEDFFWDNAEALKRYVTGWFQSVNGMQGDKQGYYAAAKAYYESRGARVPPFDEFYSALAYTRLSRSASESIGFYLTPSSPAYWRIPWQQRVDSLRESGDLEAIPPWPIDFVATEVLYDLQTRE